MLAAIQRLFDAWNAHDPERVAACYAENYIGQDVGQAAPEIGPADVKARFARYLRAFPDLRFDLVDTVIEDNRAMLVWVAHGTHQGELMRIPASGRPVQIKGMSSLVFEHGLIVQGTYLWDVAGLLRAIGLLPELTR